MTTRLSNAHAVILAGGTGTRLWPWSRSELPKQFLSFMGDDTMLKKTYKRLLKIFPARNIWVVAKPAYKHIVLSQLRGINPDRLLLEPAPKGTAAAIVWACSCIQCLYPDATVATFPSDHFISGEDAFSSCIEQGIDWAATHPHIVMFGIQPTRPESGYGYIQTVPQTNNTLEQMNIFPVKAFHEKPDQETAKKYITDKDYLWNSGIFAFSCMTLLQIIHQLDPTWTDICKELAYHTSSDELNIQKILYTKLPDTSFDKEVLEKLAELDQQTGDYKLVTVRAHTFSWYDVGVWESYYELSEKDAAANVLKGDRTLAIDCKDSLVIGDEGMAVAAIGLNNVVVVTCADAVLVCNKDSLGKIRDVVAKLKLKGFDDYT